MTTTLIVNVDGDYQRNVLIKGVSTTVGPNESRPFGIEANVIVDVKLTPEEYVVPSKPRDVIQEIRNVTRDETHPAGATISLEEQMLLQADEEAQRGPGETTLTIREQIEAARAEEQRKAEAAAYDDIQF
jgi:hypothetical protein